MSDSVNSLVKWKMDGMYCFFPIHKCHRRIRFDTFTLAGFYFFSLICFSVCLLAWLDVPELFWKWKLNSWSIISLFQEQKFCLPFLKAIKSVISLFQPCVFKNLFKLPVLLRTIHWMCISQLLHRMQNYVDFYLDWLFQILTPSWKELHGGWKFYNSILTKKMKYSCDRSVIGRVVQKSPLTV